MHSLSLLRKAAVVAATLLGLVQLTAASAVADGGKGGNFANAGCNASAGTCNAVTGTAVGTGSPVQGGLSSGVGLIGHPADCPVPYTYQPVSDINGAPLTLNPGDNVAYTAFPSVSQPEQFVDVLCQGTLVRTVLVPLGGSPAVAPTVTGADLARQAYASFRLLPPTPGMAPRPDRLVVQFPTWLWVGEWKAETATASVPGLSATVTAAPNKVVWTMGDGGGVTCNDAGTPYDPRVPADQQSTDCSYTYHESSAGQPGDAYRGSVTVSYGASWTATNGTGGNLGALTVTAAFTVRVGEIQAIGIPAS